MASTHLTSAERDELSRLLWTGVPKLQAAKLLGRHPTTITREIKRNSTTYRYSGRRGYCPIAAQQLCEQRRHRPRTKKMQCREIREYVQQRLKQCWSPDQIAGRSALDFPTDRRRRISHTTIYRWIDDHDHPRPWRQCLRRYRAKKHRKKTVPAVTAIANRPEVIERRERIGDWEGDTIHGAGHSGALVSLVERKTGYAIFAKVDNLQAQTVTRPILRRMRAVPPSHRLSATFDNGSEFASYQQLVASLGIDVYFARPRCPWQRGTNENTNGLVRQFLPKGTCFRELTPAAVARIQILLNGRPRKRLGYRTPFEAFTLLAVQC